MVNVMVNHTSFAAQKSSWSPSSLPVKPSCHTWSLSPVTLHYSSPEIMSSTGKFTVWIAFCLRSLQPAHRAKHSAIRTRWWSELGGATLLFLDWSQALPDDGHPYLLYDYRRSILFDYYYLGVPGIVLQIILSRANPVGLCRGSQVPHCCTIP